MTENKNYNRRWIIWGVLALAYVIVFFHRVAAGVVRDDLISAFNITDVEFGTLAAMYSYAYMIMQIPCGILADTLGARKTVSIGTLFAGIGSIILGIAPNIYLAYLGRLIVGLGVSVVFISILKVLSQWFREDEFGRMSGLTSFIGNGGALLAQAPLVILVGVTSWRFSFGLIGIITIFVAVLAFIIVRNSPEDLGLEPLVKSSKKEKISILKGMKIVFFNPKTWPGFFAFGGMFGSLISFMGAWGVPYMKAVYGLEKGKASTFTMTVTIGLMVGSLVVGTISDKLGKRKLPFITASLLYILTWVVLLFVNEGNMSFISLYILFFIMGFAASGFVLSWACAKEVNPPQYAGLSTSLANMGGFLFAALIQSIIGYILDKGYDYKTAFMVCLGSSIIALISILFVKETNCKNVYNK